MLRDKKHKVHLVSKHFLNRRSQSSWSWEFVHMCENPTVTWIPPNMISSKPILPLLQRMEGQLLGPDFSYLMTSTLQYQYCTWQRIKLLRILYSVFEVHIWGYVDKWKSIILLVGSSFFLLRKHHSGTYICTALLTYLYFFSAIVSNLFSLWIKKIHTF